MKWFRSAGVAVALAGAIQFALAPATHATTAARAGGVDIVSEGGSTTPRDSGGSATPFSLRLPSGAACPGDSANAGYRVQSFIVPASDDPGALTYNSVGPAGKGLYALYDIETRSFAQEQTANAQHQDDPGVIVNLPTFSYAVFPPGTLGDGTYHIGIACTHYNATMRYWSTDIVVTNTPDDKPAGLLWRVAAARKRHTGSPAGALLAVAATGVVVVAVVRLARRPRSSAGR